VIFDEWSRDDSPLCRSKCEADYQGSLEAVCQGVSDEASLMVALRVFRRQEMMRIVARDLLNLAELEETLADVTALADVSVRFSLNWLYAQLIIKHGVPMSREQRGAPAYPQKMFVLAMGKHGARELNVSSDIDLIFAFPESGETNHPRKPIENQLFFTRLGQRLIHVLDQMTADGFVFRVDMRLRPYGDSGALAMNFSAFEDYYYNQGREWERYAMIKVRVVNPQEDPVQAAKLIDIIRPFVYRKYADFTSIQALREMKRLIMSEVHRKGGDQNIKLGFGGIREIEFIAQACQLIYGGRDESLQLTGLMPVYALLKVNDYLPAEWVDQLVSAYRFLRNLEHAIQGLADQQTQMIPESSESKERVAWSMSFGTWAALALELNTHREAVNACFEGFLSEPEGLNDEDKGKGQKGHWLTLWQMSASESEWVDAFREAGFDAPEQSYQELSQLKDNRLFILMSAEARQRFESFLPLLLNEAESTPKPSVTLSRMLGLASAILGRTVYFVLLNENPGALKQLCHLCSESPWISEHIAKSPVILDELLDARTLFQPPNKTELQDELRQQLLRIPEDDLEAQMNCLRTFRQSHMLRVAASEIGGHLPLMQVSDYLTWLAESILEQSMNIAWHNLVEKHGLPSCLAENDSLGAVAGRGFAIVGYGKLGGIELGYSSDLDMVFIYDANDHGMTSGERSINNQVFYVRLGQRIIHILSAQTTQGTLYESDMRLRPSGNSGMLVSSLAAFHKYQNNDAWTWEHQALVRARAVAGDPILIERFEGVRQEVLTKAREPKELIAEVSSMRAKMKAEAKNGSIKEGDGGLIDIEFITQLGVLMFASTQPALLEWTDNVRLLDVLSKNKSFGDVDLSPLIESYRVLRSALHRNSLADEGQKATIEQYPELTQQVRAIWKSVFIQSE
jgi:glutamate-ammonia-ligase adenylyltransferase